VRVTAIAVTGLVIALLAVGSWLGSRTESAADAADRGTVTGAAVVVSSLACVAGAGQTLVDVLPPAGSGQGATPVRARLNGCGFQEGQQLSVQYRESAPATVTLADTGGTASGALLPLGLTVAGLLAVGAALAVYVDGRSNRRRRHAAGPDGRLLADGEEESGDPGSPSAAAEPSEMPRLWDDDADPRAAEARSAEFPSTGDLSEGELSTAGTDGGRDRRPARGNTDPAVTGWDFFSADAFPPDPRSTQYPDHNGHGPFTAAQARTTSPVDTADDLLLPDVAAGSGVKSDPAIVFPWVADGGGRREIFSVDLVFPSSAELAASLHDELFTHRGPAG
jgi:hypothetical protein